MIKRVMILENDKDVLDVMQEALLYEGYDVKAIPATDDIMALITEYQPDILLTDYQLDMANGGEICRLIKSNPATQNLPVIILSAYVNAAEELACYHCDAFIPKPFDLNELTGMVNKLTMPAFKVTAL